MQTQPLQITRPTAYQYRPDFNSPPSDPGPGWRFLLEEECDEQYKPSDTEFWWDSQNKWHPSTMIGRADKRETTYRTQAPLPGGPWYNPAGLLWPGLGYRFLLQGELICEGDELLSNESKQWNKTVGRNVIVGSPGYQRFTYRTTRPLPSVALTTTTMPNTKPQYIFIETKELACAVLCALRSKGWELDPNTDMFHSARAERGFEFWLHWNKKRVSTYADGCGVRTRDLQINALSDFLALLTPTEHQFQVHGHSVTVKQGDRHIVVGCQTFAVSALRELLAPDPVTMNGEVTARPLAERYIFTYGGEDFTVPTETLHAMLAAATCEEVTEPLDEASVLFVTAPLHNPANLTPEQVGVGYRLLRQDEVAAFNRREAPWCEQAQYWSGEWAGTGGCISAYGIDEGACGTVRIPISA